ncbi:nuclear transport factor 2 family protein [Spirosoma areae]
MDYQDLINRAYRAFNARNIDGVLELMHPAVEWPNGWEGGYVSGHEEVRAYWLRQWQELDPEVVPVSIQLTPSKQIDVTVHQVVRERLGKVVTDGLVKHLYTLEEGKIKRMVIETV